MALNKVPTLLVGLGGIGCSIADMTAALLTEEQKKYVGVIGLDTNREDLVKLKIKTIQTSDERLVKDYLAEHPEYTEWFPVNKFIANRGMQTGAGQIRAISRLAALSAMEAGKFIKMDEEVKRILKKDGEKDTSRFNVFLVGSITGGTGAGLFLQIPFYIRHFLKDEYAMDNVKIRGMFMGADITKNVQPSAINKDAVMINAYACMKELNAFYLTQSMSDDENYLNLEFYEKTDKVAREEEIRDNYIKSQISRFGFDEINEYDYEENQNDIANIASDGSNIPYDAFYLIEGTDNTGSTGNVSIATVKKQIAKIIFTILFTPVKAQHEGISDNSTLDDMEQEGMNRYSSVGMCSLVYPVEKVQEYVTLRWIKELIKEEWLLLDKQFESEKKEAQARQKSDPSTEIPKIEQTYSELFKKQIKGGAGTTLAYLRKDAFEENKDEPDRPISKVSKLLSMIEEEIESLMEEDEVISAKSDCKINFKKIYDLDTADKEIARVYDALTSMKNAVTSIVKKNQYRIANEVFPLNEDTMRMNKDSNLGVYNMMDKMHPVSARFCCYEFLLELETKIEELKNSLNAINLLGYLEQDFNNNADDGIQDAEESVIMIRESRIPVIKSGRKNLQKIAGNFQNMTSTQIRMLEDYGIDTLKLETYRQLKERFQKMAKYYEEFFRGIEEEMGKNEVRLERLEKSYLENPFGEIAVYASTEAFKMAFQDFSLKVQFQLPDDTKKAILKGIFHAVCNSLEDKNKELTETQKRKRAEAINKELNQLFDKGVVDTLKTLVYTEGKGVLDITVKQAIGKELQMEKGIRPEDSSYEKERIEYEKDLVEKAMRIANPMFAVSSDKGKTEIIYLALHPENAEIEAGDPSEAATKNRLVPESCEATDFHPVNVLMDEGFSKYEIICFKSKHNYKVEDLVKYGKDSEYAKAYEKRINNLNGSLKGNGDDVVKTVVTPHLSRYWHEEGFVPPMGEEERKKSHNEILKTFVYAMGLDSFRKIAEEQQIDLDDNERYTSLTGIVREKNKYRIIWCFEFMGSLYPVKAKGKLISSSYVDLFEALPFNRKIRKHILMEAKYMMKMTKRHMDAEEMMKTINDTMFIEDLVQSQKDRDDENFFDILLKMYGDMNRNRWAELFIGLKLALFEYFGYMFDGNPEKINKAYLETIIRMFEHSSVGAKFGNDTEANKNVKLTMAEERLRSQVAALLKQKYIL